MRKLLILVSSLLFVVACKQERRYVEKQLDPRDFNPLLYADPSGITKDNSKVFTGVLKNSTKIYFHSNSTCTNVLASGSQVNLSGGISVPLLVEGVNKIFVKVDTIYNKSFCYPLEVREYRKDTQAPVITLTSPSATITDFPLGVNVKGSVDSGTPVLGTTLTIHKNSPDCSQNNLFGNVINQFTGSGVSLVVDNLTTTNFYAKAVDPAGNETCSSLLTYNHILGPLDNLNSTWTVEKDIVSKSVVESNLITFQARDVNNNALPGLTISTNLKDQDLVSPASDFLLNYSEVSPGEYQATANLNYTYLIQLTTGSIPSYSPRDIQIVYATDYPYCYQAGRVNYTLYNAEGAGTALDPFLICHAPQLKDLSMHCNSLDQNACDKHFKLMNEIDLEQWYAQGTIGDQQFVLAENSLYPLSGSFDGNDLPILNYKNDPSSEFLGMLGYVNNFSLNNLLYTYTYVTSGIDSVIGGLIFNIEGNSSISNLYVQGNITGDDFMYVGGVIGQGSVGTVIFENILLDISAYEFYSLGSFAAILSGNSSPVTLRQVQASVQGSSGRDVSVVGGLIGSSYLIDIANANVDLNLAIDSPNESVIGGLVGTFTLGTISTSYTTGGISQINSVGVSSFGGLTGITDAGGIINSFALVDFATPDCTAKCGKVLGDTYNPGSTFFTNLYSSTETVLDLGSGFLNSSVVETDINTVSQPNYFFDPLNPPLDSFDFTNIWDNNLGTLEYPSLK